MKSIVVKTNDGMVLIANVKKEDPEFFEVQDPMLLNIKINYETGNPQLFLTRYNLFSNKKTCTKIFTYGIISVYESDDMLKHLHKQYINYYKSKDGGDELLNFSRDIFDFHELEKEEEDSKENESIMRVSKANTSIH